jgi:hypothetical protein
MTTDWPEAAGFAVSLANSAAILRYPQTAHDWVRPGIMLYGGSPFADQDAASFDLKPVMTLRSRILAVQEIGIGERVGYGGTFVAHRPTRVGVVACGYADGYPRHAPAGRRLPSPAAHDDAGTGIDGHAGLRPDRHARTPASIARSSSGARACRPTRWPPLPGPSATSCSVRWRGACRSSRSERGGQGVSRPARRPFYLYRIAVPAPPSGRGSVPGLRCLEYAGRNGCRSRRSASGKRFAAIAARRYCRRFRRSRRARKTACRPASASSTGRWAAAWSAGGVVLIGGDPGIGKSTLLLQALAALSRRAVLYVSGEESGQQIAMRARRLALETEATSNCSPRSILKRSSPRCSQEKPQVAVIDSIQTLWSEQLSSAPGSVAQVRECARNSRDWPSRPASR